MSLPLYPGTYLILNSDSSRYIAADSSSAEGRPVKTADTLDNSNPDNNRFKVLCLDVFYTLQNIASGLYLGVGTDESGNPIVAWRESMRWWEVSNSGIGIWDIMAGADSYWCDYKDSSDHIVRQVSKADQGDHIQWRFIGA
jgi:hypothetical protein